MRQFALIASIVVLLRLPFIDQAIQGDDYYYLAAAQHAQIDPLHPHHARYVFLGDRIDMRGHPHPPGNAWFLALLLALMGDIYEVPYHAAYLLFSLLAAWAMWRLALHFVPERAVAATLLLIGTPPYLVNGNSLESDLPLLALWTASIALFVERRLAWCGLALFVCGLIAYQSVVIVPILGLYLWLYRRQDRASWLLLLIPLAAIGGYQLFERITSGSVPATVLAGHFETYKLQTVAMKARNAIALTGHLIILLSPVGFVGLVAAIRARAQAWLLGWMGIFFLSALVLFFAGSARYLLPLAPAYALLVTMVWRERPRLLWTCVGLELVLGLSLASVNFQHWDAYREFAAQTVSLIEGKRTWVDGEWGLRFYMEAIGGLPVQRGQTIQPGDMLVKSQLTGGVPFTTGGGTLAHSLDAAIEPTLPLRLVGPGSHSSYSSVQYGLWPFGISAQPIDRVTLSAVVAREPVLSWLPMNAPEASDQIVSGVYELEENAWRWVSGQASFLLKHPGTARKLAAEIYLPEASPARTFALSVDGKEVGSATLAGGSKQVLEANVGHLTGTTVTVALVADREFTPSGDNRRLSAILSAIGFRD